MADRDAETDAAECPLSERVDKPGAHSWHFVGDDPYIACFYCDEVRDAMTDRVIRGGRRG